MKAAYVRKPLPIHATSEASTNLIKGINTRRRFAAKSSIPEECNVLNDLTDCQGGSASASMGGCSMRSNRVAFRKKVLSVEELRADLAPGLTPMTWHGPIKDVGASARLRDKPSLMPCPSQGEIIAA
jgi:hypothetical protein